MKMELYILIGLITIVLILQIVFLLKKPKSENTATNTELQKAIFSILKPILPMSFHVVEKKHPKA